MTDEEREMLVNDVVAAGLTCPEQVCDWVLSAARAGGIAAGLEELARAKACDDDGEWTGREELGYSHACGYRD